jgi:hypothetical protein
LCVWMSDVPIGTYALIDAQPYGFVFALASAYECHVHFNVYVCVH